MNSLARWWKSGVSPWIKFVYIVLLLNGIPALIILLSIPGQTQDWFVWTIKPDASARLLGVMYANAIFLVLVGFLQPNWARVRITLVVISYFSIAATIVTFVHLSIFLQHPWYHLAFWLSMYIILFFTAPVAFYYQQAAQGFKMAVEVPLSPLARIIAVIGMLVCGLTGIGLFIDPGFVSNFWPWNLTPLVSRILGVWLTSLALAWGFSLWDGDWVRTRPMYWQALPTGVLMALLPLLHNKDLPANRDVSGPLALYFGLALSMAAAGLLAILTAPRLGPARPQPWFERPEIVPPPQRGR